MTATIEPSGLDNDRLLRQYNEALQVKSEIETAASSNQDIILDLSTAEWFAPTFLTPVSVVINRLRTERTEISVRLPRNPLIRRYLQMIDFPDGTTDPSGNYTNILPLCSIDTSSEEDVINSVASKMRELIQEQLMEEVGSITWLEYPFSEIIDNVDTHSECNYGSLLIQNYPNKNFLDFCIADDGISIPGSYDQYGHDYSSDGEALRMAIEEGVTTRPESGVERGFGLRTTAQMVCEGLGGETLLSARSSTLFKTASSSRCRNNSSPWDGTVFAARVHPPDEDFNYLDYV